MPRRAPKRVDIVACVLLVCFGALGVCVVLATTLPRWKPLAFRKSHPLNLQDLHTGDILFSSPRRNLRSTVFQPFSRSSFSHVAMAVRGPDDELYLYESDPEYGGAHLTPVSHYQEYIKRGAVCFARQLVPRVRPAELERMRHVVALVSNPTNEAGMYDYGVWSSQIRHVMPMSLSTAGTFCSSAVVEALAGAGIVERLRMDTSHVIMNDMTSAHNLLHETNLKPPYRFTSEIPVVNASSLGAPPAQAGAEV